MSRKLSKSALELINKYELIDDPNDPGNSDVFHSSRFSIITRAGIDKISAKAGIKIGLDVVYSDPYEVVVKGTYSDESGRTVTTFGESTVDQYKIDKISTSKFNEGALGLIRDFSVLLRDAQEDTTPEYIKSRQDILNALTSLNAVETTERIERTIIKKGNVTSANGSGTPIPNYRWAMAEKRANSRGVLKLAGFYDHGFFGEEESDDFKEIVKKGTNTSKKQSSNPHASGVSKESVKLSS